MFNSQVKELDCKQVLVKLSPYQDGELPDAEQRGVEKHLSACPLCSRELGELEKVTRDLYSITGPELPVNFNALVMSRVRKHGRKTFSGRLAVAYTAVFALFFIFGIFADPFSPPQIREPELRPELSVLLLEGQKFSSMDRSRSVIMQLAGGNHEKRDR